MGQGLYGAFAFGAIMTRDQIAALHDDASFFALDVEEPHFAYESEDLYMAYLIADTACLTIIGADQRYAVPLSGLAEDVYQRYREAYETAAGKWQALDRAAQQLGLSLPQGQLLFIQDYD